MTRIRHRAGLVALVLALAVAGCGEDDAEGGDAASPSSSPSSSRSPEPTASVETETPPETTIPSATDSPTSVLSTTVRRTGATVVRDNQEIDDAGLLAIGWRIDEDGGTGTWSDPVLGTVKLTWDLPDANTTLLIDSAFFGEVTGPNLAVEGVEWSSVGFTTSAPVVTGGYSRDNVPTEVPRANAVFDVPEQPVGTLASLSLNLGFPQPVLVVYDYVYV